MVDKRIISAVLTLVFLSSSFYFLYSNDDVSLKFVFDDYGIEFYSKLDDKFELVANQKVRIYDGSTWVKNAESRSHYVLVKNNGILEQYLCSVDNCSQLGDFEDYIAVVDVKYPNGASYKIKSYFNEMVDQVEYVPYKSEVCFYNVSGLRGEIWFTSINYDGLTKVIESPFSFEPNMKLEWDDRAYYSKVFNYKLANDRIIIKYRLEDDECYDVRLFDPIKVEFIYENVTYTEAKFKKEEVCVESVYNETFDNWTEPYCHDIQVLDSIKNKTKLVKTDKIKFKDKIYDKDYKYYEEIEEIHQLNVPSGDRNWDEYPCTWEVSKGVCEVIKIA